MKSFLVACLFVLCSCGLFPEKSEPVAGIYDLTITPESLVPNPANTTCGTFDPTPDEAVFEVAKEGDTWALYGCNDDGTRAMKFATYDGSDFIMHGCVAIWCIDITISLSFETNNNVTTVSGESVTVLSAPEYPNGTCTETSSVTGTRRIDAIVSE